jgi:hypothetical protein
VVSLAFVSGFLRLGEPGVSGSHIRSDLCGILKFEQGFSTPGATAKYLIHQQHPVYLVTNKDQFVTIMELNCDAYRKIGGGPLR